LFDYLADKAYAAEGVQAYGGAANPEGGVDAEPKRGMRSIERLTRLTETKLRALNSGTRASIFRVVHAARRLRRLRREEAREFTD